MANPVHLAKLKEGVEAWNKWREENKDIIPDLEEATLSGANLSKANLSKANLSGSDLHSANLHGANLHGANLIQANLGGSDLRLADLTQATLSLADFTYADLKGSNISFASLDGAILTLASLDGATLHAAHLKGAVLANASLKEVDLQYADLEGVVFISANLSGADITGVMFRKHLSFKGIFQKLKGFLNNSRLWYRRIFRKRPTRFRGIRCDTCFGSPAFKKFAQDQDYLEELRSSGWWGNLVFSLWYVLADCGRTFWRWMLWSILIALSFGIRFAGMGPEHFKLGGLNDEWGTYIYFGFINFVALGVEEFYPLTREASWWDLGEVAVAYVMLGGLISILAEKLARRS